jgi:hypothetical protein
LFAVFFTFRLQKGDGLLQPEPFPPLGIGGPGVAFRRHKQLAVVGAQFFDFSLAAFGQAQRSQQADDQPEHNGRAGGTAEKPLKDRPDACQ